MDTFRTVVVDEKDMSPELDGEIRRLLCQAFPSDTAVFSCSRSWHGSHAAFSVMLEDKTGIVAHVGMVERVVTVGDTAVRAAGVMNVFVALAKKGLGLGARVMLAAASEALHRDYDIGLLFCVPDLENFYATAGWLSVGSRTVTRIDKGEEKPLPDKNIAMYLPLALTTLPAGPIHLNGNDW